MKGECEGRELTPGAPVRVGAGLVPEHSKEGASGRIETGGKSENLDSSTKNFQMPAVLGGSKGNGTRGFSVAELTKTDSVPPTLGHSQIPGIKDIALGSCSVPAFRETCQGRTTATLTETKMQGWGESRATGTFPKFPGFMGEGQEHSGALDLTRVSHDITSGNLQVAGNKEVGQAGNVKTLSIAQQKGESHCSTKGILMQDSVIGGSSLISTKREPPKSASERNCIIPSKRLNHDGVGMKPLEAVIKRLKQDACAAINTTSIVDSKRVNENNSVASESAAAVKRISQDGASGITGMTDVKRKRQDSTSDTASVTAMVREGQSSVKETVNGAYFKNQSQDGSASTEGGEAIETERQNSVSPTADVKKIDQCIGEEFAQVKTTEVEEQSSAIRSKEDAEVKECLEGKIVKSTPQPVMQKETNTTGSLSVASAETTSQIQPTKIPSLPDKEKETPEALDRNTGDAAEPCIKSEAQDSPAEKPNIVVKEEEENKDTDKEKSSEPKQESEEKKESKQENSTQEDGKAVAKECLESVGEAKVPASEPPKPAKPEMVSIETQCDGSGMGPNLLTEEEYNFFMDDGGVPGECLGACEPGRKPHKCCQCDTSFRTPYELSRHSRVHSGERPFQCRLCHRCFKRKDHVEVHMRRHVDDRRHICGLCGICFVTSSCLLRHQRRTHQTLLGTKQPGELEEGEVEVEAIGESKGEIKDLPVFKDAQRNGRRNKKNKPDSTYRPGGKTVCIIKKRNLRQRSYSFVELEDDVECFESDEEDRIPFLKVQEQRREEEREEFGSQSGQLDHSLFPGSLFNPEGSLEHFLLLGEVSRLLSHSLIPGPLEVPDSQAGDGPPVAGRPWGPETKENEVDSDDSDCDPPLVACDVTFMEGEGEVACLSQSDDNPGSEEAQVQTEEHSPTAQNETCHATVKGEPCQAAGETKENLGTINSPPPPGEGRMARLSQPCTSPPSMPAASGKAATNYKMPGTGVGAMGVPRTAWVVAPNNAKGKNTCDACRRRNEANRLAQMEKERQAHTPQEVPKPVECKAEENLQECQAKVETKEPPAAPPPPPPPPKPQKPRSSANKRSKKASSSKKRRQGKNAAAAERAAATAQRPHKCHLCPFNFRSATELNRHASTHSGERPFLCELCGAGFVRKCHLQLHVRRHSGERRHACPECRMRFFTPSDLARHQAIHQVGDKPLECHLCHLTFRRAFHLERHIRRHNDAAPFACKLCGAFFSSAAALRSHDKHHRTPGPHACPDCTAAFTTATALSRHRRVHSARHHRLLRAVERHATAKSSYECVSSEGSPLSLVIRKVAATTGASGEGGTGPAKDSTSNVSSDPAHAGKEEEGKEVDTSTPPANGETAEGEKSASSHSITAAESEGQQEGRQNIAFSSPTNNKENPSITEPVKRDTKNSTSTPLSTVKAKEESQKLNSILSTLDKINKDSEKMSYTTLTTEGGEEREKVTSTALALGKETSSRRLSEETTTVEEDPYVFKLTAAETEAASKSGSKSNTKRNKKNNEESLKSSGTYRGKESSSKSLSSLQSPERNAGHIGDSGNLTLCGTTKREEKVSSEELDGKAECGLSTTSKEGQEPEGGGSCSLLAPTRRETDAVNEIHCRTTYHLSAPSGGPGNVLHSGSGEQESSRSSSQDGGQPSNVREGVATTS